MQNSNYITQPLKKNNQSLPGNRMFGHYQIQGELGRGGMGAVYKALDTKLNMLVALKIILVEDSQSIERFKREASATAKLDHPNIVRFYHFGESPRPYFTMEYIEGQTLDYFIKEKLLKPPQLLDIMIVVCEALAHAHVNKMLHRDLKPSNIMIAGSGIPKIMDFGLAKITEANMQEISKTGQVLGTLNYMAPEQINGKATYKSDILKKNPIPPREINRSY